MLCRWWFLNGLPYRVQKHYGDKTDTFQKHHDRLLRDIPDTPKIDNHGKSVSAKTCSITKQKKNGDPILAVGYTLCFFLYFWGNILGTGLKLA